MAQIGTVKTNNYSSFIQNASFQNLSSRKNLTQVWYLCTSKLPHLKKSKLDSRSLTIYLDKELRLYPEFNVKSL